jgi:hypothetical protein
MKRLFVTALAILALAAHGYGQEKEETVRKLIKLEHVQTGEVMELLSGWIRTFPSRELATVILQGSPEDVARAEEVIREIDRPGADSISEGSVELDAYFLSAGAESSGGVVPPLVQPVVAELQRRFSYAHYGLLDSTLVQISIGTNAHVEGLFTGTEELPTSYVLRAKPTRVSGAKGERLVKLSDVQAHWRIPYRDRALDKDIGQMIDKTYFRDLRIQTDVSVPEGKLVVVGKAGSSTSAEAIFLVLRARLVE